MDDEQKRLNDFSYKHYKYINALFGNEDIREIIKTTKSFQRGFNKDVEFEAIDIPRDSKFEGGKHQVLFKNQKPYFCSVNSKPYIKT